MNSKLSFTPETRPQRALLGVTALALALANPLAQAQNYPDKPIRLVAPNPAGSVTDILSRPPPL